MTSTETRWCNAATDGWRTSCGCAVTEPADHTGAAYEPLLASNVTTLTVAD